MAAKKQNAPVTLYADTLDRETAGIVRRIPAPGILKNFRTHVYLGAGVQADVLAQQMWLEAARLPGTENSWSISRHVRMAAPDGSQSSLIGIYPLFKNICFFDALYHLAHFDVSQKKLGEQVQAPDIVRNEPDVRQAAKAAGQPVDIEGLPHPAAEGQLLVPGMFAESEMMLAGTTQDKALAAPLVVKPLILTGTATPTASEEDAIKAAAGNIESRLEQKKAALDLKKEEREKKKKDNEKCLWAMYEIRPSLDNIARWASRRAKGCPGTFGRGVGYAFGAALSPLGVFCMPFYVAGDWMAGKGAAAGVRNWASEYKAIFNERAELDRYIEVINRNLPALLPQEKALHDSIQSLFSNISAAESFEKVAQLYHQASAKGISQNLRGKFLREAIGRFDEDPILKAREDVPQLRSKVLAGEFEAYGTFWRQIKKQSAELSALTVERRKIRSWMPGTCGGANG